MIGLASARPGSCHSRYGKVAGIVLIVVGSLWTLLWTGVWYAIWVLTGGAGVVRRDGSGLRPLPTGLERTDYGRDRRAIVVVDLATGAETEPAYSEGEFVSEPARLPLGRE